MSKLFVKDPTEVIDITIDWENILDLTGSPDDTIATSTWTAPPPTSSPDTDDIQISGPNTIGNKTVAFFSSGVHNTLYAVKNVITTDAGATFERTIYVQVVDTGEGISSSGLIKEDGSQVPGANTYISLNDCDAYHASRNNTAWFDLTPQERQAAIIKGADWLTQMYTKRWKGIRTAFAQTMDWPRAGAVSEDFKEPVTGARFPPFDSLTFLIPENSVPQEVQDANCVAALEAASRDLNPVIVRDTKNIKVAKAGSVSVEYFPGTEQITQPVEIRAADDMLAKLLDPIRNEVVRG